MTGVFPRWAVLFWIVLIAYGAFAVRAGEHADDAVLAALLVLPILAGTGLLTSARQGRIDLLLGSGAARHQVWLMAFCRAVILPLLAIAACAALWLNTLVGSPLAASTRTLIVGVITMPVAFALGMAQPRYAAGVVWAGLRIAFLLSPPGRSIYVQMAHPDQAGAPTLMRALVGIMAFPEVLLHAPIPVAATAILIMASIVILLVALVTFLRAEFGGHRTA